MKNSLLVFLLLFSFVRGYSQCTLSVNLSSSSSAICSGSSVVLTATPSAGTPPYTYAWSTGETTQTISVNKAGTYTVTVSDKTAGCQPVSQSITIASAAVPNSPIAVDVVACPNSSVTLNATAPGGTYQWYDALTGGNFLASGASYTTPAITGTTAYYVQTTINGCTSLRTTVNVTVRANPTVINAKICSGDVATLTASGGTTYTWYDSAAGTNAVGTGASFVTPPLTTTTIYYVAATTNGCTSALVPGVVTVTPPPQPPTATDVTVCAGNGVNLHATAPTGVIDWFTTPTGGTSLISSPDYTTPPLTVTTTYYAQTTINTCVSARTPVTVTVTPPPANPVAADASTCPGGTATLTASGSVGVYQWYGVPTGGTLLFSGATFTTPPVNNPTTYYVAVTNGGCVSNRTAVNVTLTTPPASPSASGAIICPNTAVTLTATAPGGTYQWYDAAIGGNLLATNTSYTTPVLSANTTYYVQTTVGGCVSGRTPVPVTLMTPTPPPTVSGTTICSGATATLIATDVGGSHGWYDSLTGGTLLSIGQAYVTPALTATTTYYVEAIGTDQCASLRTPVTVTVTPLPPAPTVPGVTICSGNAATLTATAPLGTVSWYTTLTGGTPLATGNSFTTPVLFANKTYYAEQVTATCPGPRAPVTVTMNTIGGPQFQYAAGTFCTTAPNPTPVLNNPAGGIFSASPAGLVFVSTTSGQINIAASTPGIYTVSYAGNGVCPTTTTAIINITNTPNPAFSYTGPYCQDNPTNAFPTFPLGASAGVFTASPAGLVFSDPSTGEINMSASTAGTYNVTNTIPASGTCPSASSTVSVTIDPKIVVNAGPDQTVQVGNTVQLAGSVTGASGGKWSGGTGSFSSTTALNAIYTPGPGETSATLTLISTGAPASCGPQSDAMVITFSAQPAGPLASGAIICMGDLATLTAVAPGGLYKWYDAPTNGNLLAIGPVFTSPPLTVNTTYYVQTTVGNVTSLRTAVTVQVNPPPAAPVAPGVSICSGNAATLTATGSTGNYQWFDSAIGGNLLSTNSTYTTTFLTANTSYYVQGIANGCPGTRTKVDVTISPVPTITSAQAIGVCSGSALSYTITANMPAATFSWSRASVAGISNPAVVNQTSSTITETLINTGNTPVTVTYVIIPTANGCPGTPFNYMVTVSPAPKVTSAATATICSGTSVNYSITFDTPGVSFVWGRNAVPGITNAAVTGQRAATVNEVLFNSTNAPIVVGYYFNYTIGGCSTPFSYYVTVNPSVNITSVNYGTACSGTAQAYVITSDVPGTTYSWSRTAVPGISNPSVSNQTDDVITETLINTTTGQVRVNYNITPIANGCSGTTLVRSILVNPQPATPKANANSPVCVGSTIHLQTPVFANATYTWTGPNGFTSASQNPNITGVTVANSGTYSLFVTVNGCPSVTSTVDVVVDPPPAANAGPDQVVCNNATSVQLAGTITGGTTTGIWSTSGTGTFSPAANVLNAQYVPSAKDATAGTVKLTLASTSKDDCSISTAVMNITFQVPTVTSAKTGEICPSTAQNYVMTANTSTANFVWSRAAVAGISNPAVTNQTSGTITESLDNTTTAAIPVIYIITPFDNGCPGTPFTYTVTVDASPATPTATSNSPVCVNTPINLSTPTVAGATYSWIGPGGFTSASQNPSIASATAASAGVYTVTISINGCPSQPGVANVVVDPPPVVKGGPNQTVCNNVSFVQLAGTVTGGTGAGTWSTAGTGTFAPTTGTLNAQYIPSATDVTGGSVKLTLTSTSTDNCAIVSADVYITFQTPKVTSAATGAICTATAQNYVITGNTATATFNWSRATVAGISNTAVSNQATGTIDEALINTTTAAIPVAYIITPSDNGCPGTPFTYTVTVNASPVTPVAKSNSPVCVASTIDLTTTAVSGATYSWTGPNGFTAASQNPTVTDVSMASAGSYSVVVSVNGCPSPAGSVSVVIDQPPLAVAGPDQAACPATTYVQLSGSVTGGTITGVWSSSGTGTFSPSANTLNAKYLPSAQDITTGSVTLTLSSSSTDNCALSTSSLTVTFQLLTTVKAGPDQTICSQDAAVLTGQIGIGGGGVWSSTGTGTFMPAANQLNTTYVPSAADVKAGSVTLTLTANGGAQCYIQTDALKVTLIPPPTVNAGGTFYVLKNSLYTLHPVVSDDNVTYLWSPDIDISSTTIKNPVITGDVDRTYTLTVTDSRGCVSSDQLFVKVSPEIIIPNAFTPNGDGINDYWVIKGLTAYQHAVIDIFDRYGQKLFHSVGYGQPWDGTNNGKQVPFGTYYYIIDTKMYGIILSGYIAVVR